jgi:hypothetical protein
MSDEQPPARRARGRPRRETPTESANQRLEADIADWYAKESVRTGIPIATIQRLVLTRYVREREKPPAPIPPPAAAPPTRPSRFARSRYLSE